MKIFDRFVVKYLRKRGFEAAKITRLNKSWGTATTTINWDIRQGLANLRARSRELVQNDPYANKYVRMIDKYVVGPEGFTHRNKSYDWVVTNGKRVKKFDNYANTVIQDAFWEWSKAKNCTITGTMSLRKLLYAIRRGIVIDGEVFVKKVYQSTVDSRQSAGFGFALQLIDPGLCDEGLNRKLESGNVVVMGIEYNAYRRPTAYWFKKVTVDNALQPYQAKEYVRIPADQIFHLFDLEFPDQMRGYPRFAPIAERAHVLKGYEDAALQNARSAARKANILEPIANEDTELTSADIAGGYDDVEEGEDVIVQNIQPGETFIVPRGYKHLNYDPAYPQGEHAPFVENMLMGVASGLDVDYPTLSSNLSNVNYTSTRHGLLDARAGYRKMQADLREDFLEPLHTAWLEAAILNGYLNLPMAKLAKFDAPVFYGYRGDWVDPLKDIKAQVEGNAANIITLEEICAERGKDLTEVLDQLEVEAAELKRRELGQHTPLKETGDEGQGTGDGVEGSSDEGQGTSDEEEDGVRTLVEEILAGPGNGKSRH